MSEEMSQLATREDKVARGVEIVMKGRKLNQWI